MTDNKKWNVKHIEDQYWNKMLREWKAIDDRHVVVFQHSVKW